MSKYSFERMSPDQFEAMAQALLESTYRVGGNLIQFGSGKDGGREATWTQPPEHPTYARPANEASDVSKEWVYQVKYHDIGLRGWAGARDTVVTELKQELHKIVHKHKVPCHAYVMITNVPFTGARGSGTKDKAAEIAKEWKTHIPEIYIWDAADLSRMLDANESVRTRYLDDILPGDILKAIYKGTVARQDRTKSALRAYLQYVIEREGSVRAEEAGDEPGIPLADVFIDLTLRPVESTSQSIQQIHTEWAGDPSKPEDNESSNLIPCDLNKSAASFALLFADHNYMLLLGGPGLGKSTLTQFLVLYQAARAVDPPLALRVAQRLKLPDSVPAEELDAFCQARFPFRIELRRYARWMTDQITAQKEAALAHYISDVLINPNVSAMLEMDDIFALVASDPILLVLDGLDEVPHPETRKMILKNLAAFLRRAQAENGDVQLILSSRPKGYSGEFEAFEPLTWELNELDRSDFDDYCNLWMEKRIRDAEERREARERIERGMQSEAVQRLAQSLLQATVMLAIVRSKTEIPHQRHELYDKYVKVIFDREKEKSPIVRERSNELLRLHERVGYELHRKMAQTQVEALDQDSFRTYVFNVLEDYSGDDLGDKTLRQVADEIIAAATDRLCLLVGKGHDQTDIDFVVQSYREYFAAAYFANHPDADPDKVFMALVRRGSYWANVLQFYAAQAHASQQSKWVLRADGRDQDWVSSEAIIGMTRLRRALMNMLPEFTLQRRSDFQRALDIIFDPKTRWTWFEQEWAASILQGIRSGTAAAILYDLFAEPSVRDKATLTAELWLLARMGLYGSAEYEKLCSMVQTLIDDHSIQEVAMVCAVNYDIEISLDLCDFSVIRTAFDKRVKDFPDKLVSLQSKEKQCEILLSTSYHEQGEPFDKLHMYMKYIDVDGRDMKLEIMGKEIGFKLCLYLYQTLEELDNPEMLSDNIENSEFEYMSYFDALIRALQNPMDLDKDIYVREIEKKLPVTLDKIWKTDRLLGPSLSSFSSPNEWLKFKRLLVNTCRENPSWLSEFEGWTGSSNLWTILIFHPEDWPFLISKDLITQEEYNNVSITPIKFVLELSLQPLKFVKRMRYFSIDNAKIPVFEIIDIAICLAEDYGIDRIGNPEILLYALHYRNVEAVETNKFENILKRILRLPPLPECWAMALFQLCLSVPDCNTDLLLDVWDHVKGSQYQFILRDSEFLSYVEEMLLDRLICQSRPSALCLAAKIILSDHSRSKKNYNIPKEKLFQALDYYISESQVSRIFMDLLMSLTPEIDEFAVWQNPQVFAVDYEYAQQLTQRVSTRFKKSIQHLEPDQLRQCLMHFITRRHEYPSELVRAALEAILEIDESNLPLLEDTMWKYDP